MKYGIPHFLLFVACTFSGKRNSRVYILEHMTGVQNAL